MYDGDTEKYHFSCVIQDFVFLSLKKGSIRCISLPVYNNKLYLVNINAYIKFGEILSICS